MTEHFAIKNYLEYPWGLKCPWEVFGEHSRFWKISILIYPVFACFVLFLRCRVETVDDKLGRITGVLLKVCDWWLVLHTQGPWSALPAAPHHAVLASTWAAVGDHQQAPAQHVRREAIAAHQVGVSKVFGFCIMQTWALAGVSVLNCGRGRLAVACWGCNLACQTAAMWPDSQEAISQ